MMLSLISHCHHMDGWLQMGPPSLVSLPMARITGSHVKKQKRLPIGGHGVWQPLWCFPGCGNVISRHLLFPLGNKVWLPYKVFSETRRRGAGGISLFNDLVVQEVSERCVSTFPLAECNAEIIILSFECRGKNYTLILTWNLAIESITPTNIRQGSRGCGL